ncbi:flavodoxin reductase [Pseudaestuariivita atlantica]|uniref:Flavodoxin reductase n=1 Tax=Pseudaestuariivita atlantica TaxID=1317121 RepID=A0A0L1JR12_9RHOB|nr:flavodoxin reductase [Pseudaestuariivita atlantica]KNG94175.1 flavodoxin reductase [Pseudaestuariivita atlantica]
MTHTLALRDITPVTHDTFHLVFDRPDGFDFTPGQATELALDREGWRDKGRPFTFTSLPEDETLEFVIKSYPDHDGVTEQIAKLQAGDTVLIGDAWGAIEDKGPGLFVAGGAGVTPFIAILKARLKREGTLQGSTLLFSNKTERDIILRDTFEHMDGLKTVFTVTDEETPGIGVQTGFIDKEMLANHGAGTGGHVYICGPEKMVSDMAEAAKTAGAPEDRIVHEDFS